MSDLTLERQEKFILHLKENGCSAGYIHRIFTSGTTAGFSLHAGVAAKARERGKGSKAKGADGQDEKAPVQRRAATTWAQRLKRYSISISKRAANTVAPSK